MSDYIKYKPTSEEWDKIKGEYWEVWEGIPKEILKDSFSTRNGGLKYNKNYQWIEIPPNIISLLKENPKAVLFVKLEKDCNYDKKVVGIAPSAKSLEEAIKSASEKNKELIEKYN